MSYFIRLFKLQYEMTIKMVGTKAEATTLERNYIIIIYIYLSDQIKLHALVRC